MPCILGRHSGERVWENKIHCVTRSRWGRWENEARAMARYGNGRMWNSEESRGTKHEVHNDEGNWKGNLTQEPISDIRP